MVLKGFYGFLSVVVIQDKMKKDRNIYIYINTCIYLRVTTSLSKKKLYVLITVLIGIKALLEDYISLDLILSTQITKIYIL